MSEFQKPFEQYKPPNSHNDPSSQLLYDILSTLNWQEREGAGGALDPQDEMPPAGEPLHFAYARNGVRVVYDPEGAGAHASTHFADTPQLRELAVEAIACSGVEAPPDKEIFSFDVDLKRQVGVSYMVPTDETDEIVYARRPHRDIPMRFTRSRQPEPTSLVTIVLQRRDEPASYDLFSAWVGPNTPTYPGTPNEMPHSREFWESHALVWGTQEIEAGTETPERPW